MARQKQMPFLLLREARRFSLRDVLEMDEDGAWEMLKEIRWGKGGPRCPECGCDVYYERKIRRQFICKRCGKHFSLTSGTLFHSHNLPLRVYLAAVTLMAGAVKGMSALELGRHLNLQYRSAYVLAHKIREAMGMDAPAMLTGEVEVDAAYVGTYERPANKKADRKARGEPPDKMAVLTLRQRSKGHPGAGPTVNRVIKSENAVEVERAILDVVAPGSTIITDQHPCYLGLPAHGYTHKSVNHSVEYSSDEGINTNQAESIFSRFRRMYIGQHHHISPEYLSCYAAEIAYREQHRLESNRDIVRGCLGNALRATPSERFKGYWKLYMRNALAAWMAAKGGGASPPATDAA